MHPPAIVISSCFLRVHLNNQLCTQTPSVYLSHLSILWRPECLCFLPQLLSYWGFSCFLISYLVFRLQIVLVFATSRPCDLVLTTYLSCWVVGLFVFVLLLHPHGFLLSLVFISTDFWHIFCLSDLSSHIDNPCDPSTACVSLPSLFLQCVALTAQEASGAFFSRGCRSPLRSPLPSLLPTTSPVESRHWSSLYFSLLNCLRTRGLRGVLPFPLLLHKAHVVTVSRPVCVCPC